MFSYLEPIYKQNMILSAQILQDNAMYVHNSIKNIYLDYSDGIISGVEIEITDAYIMVHPGLIKYNHMLFSLNEVIQIPYENSGETTFLRIRFKDPVEVNGGISYGGELILTHEETEFFYDMELGRFTASKGARLYYNTESFSKLALMYDNFDIRFVKYAGVGEPTISPLVTSLFAKEMMKKKLSDMWDVSFTMKCLEKTPVSREVIKAYIKQKTNKEVTDITNLQIYKELEQILTKPTSTEPFQRRESQMRRIIVD